MKLIKYCGITGGNFGDDINLQLWERLFPNLAQLKGKVLFYGVGTLLDDRHDQSIKKVVLGTGIGEAHAALADANWDFRWVRGPKTASEFGLSKAHALGDAAILWPELTPGHDTSGPVGLIPHYATWDSYDWVNVARQAGMVVINPRQAPGVVIDQMRACSRILAESLHGAICADAMGIPWAACILAHRFNEFKWRDWLATIHRAYEPLVMDRPLVRDIPLVKSMANKVARSVRYQRLTRHPSLRPVAAATLDDARAVSQSLHNYAKCALNFTNSDPLFIARQKKNMLLRCQEFARDYELQFTPP
ncbi:MAG: polysaccharide pyruvyl transferase family protein [Pseudomonadota bacterium]